ncbi:MAG: c-type cytochrome biogenesis protein CcmI [Alphaproteobacteria bacterium]|nr:MAG: c-type cytochrome biogenesis protein CcmI [Alphaproteobacteria bacterium]
MLFWIFITVIALLVAALLLRPLWLAEDKASTHIDALEVYKRQLRELERDVEAGIVPAVQAEATRMEIERRLLAADKDLKASAKAPSALKNQQRVILAVALAIALPVISLTLYEGLGAPGYGDLPYKSRCEALGAAGPQSEVDMMQLIDCLAVRMEENPQPEGLVMLGRSYMNLGRYADATRAYARAVEIGGPALEPLEGLGISLLYLNQGQVTDSARVAFAEAVKLEGDTSLSKFYLAEYDYQHGKPLEALSAWVDLLEEIPRDTPMFGALDDRIQRGIAEQESISLQSGGRGAPVAQSDQVKAMVAGLAARLEEDPHDLDGWLMLIKSYHVQGRDEEARQALSTATLTFVAEPQALQQILILAEELGLSPRLEVPLEPAQ